MVDFQNGINDERVAAVAGARAHARLRDHDRRRHVRARPRDAHRHRQRSASRSASTTARTPPRARALAEVMSDVAGDQGDDQPVRRALVEARRQLHGQSDRRASAASARPRCAPCPGRGASRSTSAAEVIRVGRAARLRGRADLRHRAPSASWTPPRAAGWRRSRPTSAASAQVAAGGRPVPAAGRDARAPHRDRLPERLRGATQGRRRGVPTPFNDAIVELVRSHGVGELNPDPKNLEPMLKVLPR